MNLPAGTTTISGQSLAHSLKASLGLSACSASAVSTWGRTWVSMYGRMVLNQRQRSCR